MGHDSSYESLRLANHLTIVLDFDILDSILNTFLDSLLTILLKFSRCIDAINERIGQFAYWLVLAMLGVGCWNVVGRYVGQAIGQNLSSNSLIETQWYLFSIIFLLGAAYTLKSNGHVRVDMFQSRWSVKRKALAELVGTVFFLLPFCILVIAFSWKVILASWKILEISPDPGGLPRYPIKSMIIVGFVTLVFQGISEAIKNLAILTDHPSVLAGRSESTGTLSNNASSLNNQSEAGGES